MPNRPGSLGTDPAIANSDDAVRPIPAMIDLMRVRAAVEADAEAVATVHVESWRSTYRGLVPDDYLAGLSVERRAGMWRQLIAEAGSDRGVVVLEEGGKVIGFCHYGPSRDSDAQGTGEVMSIYLMAEQWRHGGGTRLLNAALSAMTDAGYAHATLWVLEENTRARTFYDARSWVPDGAVKVDDREAFQLREVRYCRPLSRTSDAAG
jgi:ribosomal protein S18 acetylase RimI-like enzyme